nr:uncharacterized protein LOC128704922 [Cherax quadricarinatus]
MNSVLGVLVSVASLTQANPTFFSVSTDFSLPQISYPTPSPAPSSYGEPPSPKYGAPPPSPAYGAPPPSPAYGAPPPSPKYGAPAVPAPAPLPKPTPTINSNNIYPEANYAPPAPEPPSSLYGKPSVSSCEPETKVSLVTTTQIIPLRSRRDSCPAYHSLIRSQDKIYLFTVINTDCHLCPPPVVQTKRGMKDIQYVTRARYFMRRPTSQIPAKDITERKRSIKRVQTKYQGEKRSTPRTNSEGDQLHTQAKVTQPNNAPYVPKTVPPSSKNTLAQPKHAPTNNAP